MDFEENSTCLYSFSLDFYVMQNDPQKAKGGTLPMHLLVGCVLWHCKVTVLP